MEISNTCNDGTNDDITIRCRVRIYKRQDNQHVPMSLSDLRDVESGTDMICTMHRDDSCVNSWNLWEGMNAFESIDQDSKIEEPVEIINESRDHDTLDHYQHGGPSRLAFHPVLVPSLSRPSSRIRSRSARFQRPTVVGDADLMTDLMLSDTQIIEQQGQRVLYPVRSGSPTNRFDESLGAVSQRIKTSPGRDASDIAAACFAVGEDPLQGAQSEPFDVHLSDIISVKRSCELYRNAQIGVIIISTQKCGFLEILPNSEHARDLLLAFLQVTLPKGIVEDPGTIASSRQLLSKASSHSFDMQDFEENAVNKTLASESLWDRMARKSATLASRFNDLCVCCENGVETNELTYKSQRHDDVECCNSTVESVLSEMELDTVDEDCVSDNSSFDAGDKKDCDPLDVQEYLSNT